MRYMMLHESFSDFDLRPLVSSCNGAEERGARLLLLCSWRGMDCAANVFPSNITSRNSDRVTCGNRSTQASFKLQEFAAPFFRISLHR